MHTPAACLLMLVSGALAAEPVAPASAPAVDRPAIAGRRIVKHFDFNEVPLGNYEPLPMLWRRHGGHGFPLYLEGRFDPQIGRADRPSFRLDLDGGSLAYHYEGRDISVRTNSDYLVVAWVRTAGLTSARAYMTAYYLDRKGAPIPGGQGRSILVGGEGGDTDWQPITVALPGNLPGSRYIGISLWLTQASIWRITPPGPREIEREDVKGTAWFDDITVYRLPRVSLTSSRPGNVFGADEPVELRTEVTDPDGLNLSAVLEIRDAEDRPIRTLPVGISTDDAPRVERHGVGELPVGLYRAELRVNTGPTLLVRRELRFVRLAPAIGSPQESGRRFGLVLHTAASEAFNGQRDILARIPLSHIKLPAWSIETATSRPATGLDRTLDRYLEAIVEAGADPIGVLSETPEGRTPDKLDPTRSLPGLMSQDPRGWKPLIAGTWTRYAGLIHIWQVGSDWESHLLDDARLPDVLTSIRREMGSVIAQPRLAAPAAASREPDAGLPSEYRSVRIEAGIPAGEIARHVRPQLAADADRCWLVVEPPTADAYPRLLRLAEWSRRLVEAAYCRPGSVLAPAPWDVTPDALTASVNPHEDLIVFRTISDLLGGATPISRLHLDGQAECIVFDHGGRAVLYVRDPYAPPEGRPHTLLLGREAQIVDLWGERRPIEQVGDQQRIHIGPMPQFIINTPTWLIEFRRQFRLEPPNVEASFDVYEREIVFRNTYHQPISGLLRLVPPENWEIRPNKISFIVEPGQEFRHPVTVRFPLNAEAGVTPLVGEFAIDADRRYHLTTPAWFELNLQGIDMDTHAYREGQRIVVRQTLTNRTGEPVSFEGYLLTPGRPRINRTFSSFESGQTVTKEFILDDADDLTGTPVRVGLKEIQGTRVWNRIVVLP